MEDNKVFVGCCMLVLNPKMDKVLLSRRKKDPDIGGWQIPGGSVDYSIGENVLDAAKREALEETGIKVENPKFLCLMNTFYYGKNRPIHIGFFGVAPSDKIPENPEPNKSEDWQWFDLNQLPEGKWFRQSKVALDYYLKSKESSTIDSFVLDNEYKNFI